MNRFQTTRGRTMRPGRGAAAALAFGLMAAVPGGAEAAITGTGNVITATEGQQFNKNVVTFITDRQGSRKDDFQVLVDWRDQTAAAGRVQSARNGYLARAKKTYSSCGTFPFTVTVTDTVNGDSAVLEGRVVVAAPGGTAPVLTAPVFLAAGAQAETASVPSVAGSAYTWILSDAEGNDRSDLIVAGQGGSQLTFRSAEPGTTVGLEVIELPANSCPRQPAATRMQVDFLDVGPAHPFRRFVNTLAGNGVTAGCGGGNYCPDTSTLRRQMAVFLLVAKEGLGYVPPDAVGLFADVPTSDPFARWIEDLANRGVSAGCGNGRFCPDDATARQQMAVFLLAASNAPGYVPPPAVGVFDDVPVSSPYAAWVEDLAARGITGGCSSQPPLFCPGSDVTRGQMAVFLVATFGLSFP